MRKAMAALVLSTVLSSGASAQTSFPDPIQVDGGLISGVPAWGAGVRMYRGVPFAAPPVGDLRWRAPQPVRGWKDVRRADKFGPACIQERRPLFTASWNFGANGYSEDCLYLNVWTPAKSAGARLPVMVWIPGGGGREGSGGEPIYDPSRLAKRGVVVVTVNYRVNLFGWMAHPELTAESGVGSSGNYGALDQVAALQWVKRNISAFGGDPDAVTVFGESGGSRSVNWLMASPIAKGLFRGAIGESHTIFDTITTRAEAEATGVAFANKLGAPTVAGLRALPAETLLQTYLAQPAGMNAVNVDGWFLPDQVRAIFERGQQNDVALLTGGNDDEPGDSRRPQGPPKTVTEYRAWALATFGERAGPLLDVYRVKSDSDVARVYRVFQRDANLSGHRTWAALQSRTGKQPAFLYNFAYGLPAFASDGRTPGRRRASHMAEIYYVFDNLKSEDRPWTGQDQKMADLMAAYWSNFARNLDPNGKGLPKWPRYTPQGDDLLLIDVVTRAQKVPNPKGMDLQDAHNRNVVHPVWKSYE